VSLSSDLAPFIIAAGVLLIVLARWAARVRGSRLDSLVALRVGDVLVTEVLGVFLVGLGIGTILWPPDAPIVGPGPGGAPRPPVGRGRFIGFGGPGGSDRLPFLFGVVLALVAVLVRIDLRDLLLGGRAARNAITSYIGWDARVIAAIPAGGYGEIAMRDGAGNVISVAATADTDIAEGTLVRVTSTRDLNLVVAPLPARV
jgi:hypothetical protein